METDAAFVGADGVVMLYTITHVGADVALVVCPRHTELVNTVGDAKALNEVGLVKFGMFVVLFFDGT